MAGRKPPRWITLCVDHFNEENRGAVTFTDVAEYLVRVIEGDSAYKKLKPKEKQKQHWVKVRRLCELYSRFLKIEYGLTSERRSVAYVSVARLSLLHRVLSEDYDYRVLAGKHLFKVCFELNIQAEQYKRVALETGADQEKIDSVDNSKPRMFTKRMRECLELPPPKRKK